MEPVFLDYNSTTPLDSDVLEAMRPYFSEQYGNSSSIHSYGRKAQEAIENSRDRVAKVLNCSPEEIFFTSGGTESDNLALKGAAWAGVKKGRHVITSAIEHHAILESAAFLEDNGFEVTCLAVDRDGCVSPDVLKKALRPDTVVVSVMAANNETGAIQPLAELSAICHDADVPFHTDAVQAAGKIKVDLQELGVAMASFSAHKFYGPKGTGVLFVRKGTRLTSHMHGGGHEKGRRAGTVNVPGVVGFAAALEKAENLRQSEHARLSFLSDYFMTAVKKQIPDTHLNGPADDRRVPSTCNISFAGVEGESIILALDLKGIAVASGSACTSGAMAASHVLTAMGIDPEIAQGAIRFSLGRQTTQKHLDYTLSVLPETIERLRTMSPTYSAQK